MSTVDIDAVRDLGAACGEAISIFMLNPVTMEKSLADGYPDPFSAYFAGRGGVLGDTTGTTVNAVFAVFEPNVVRTCWEQGVSVHDATKSAGLYWNQVADFARAYLSGADGLSPRNQALLTGVDELVATRMLSDQTWQRLAAYLDRKQLMEFVMLVGQYDALAMWLNTLGVPMDYPD